MAYSKKAAVNYADKYWNIVCDDLCAAIETDPFYKKLPAGTKYVPGKDSRSEHAVDPDGKVVATWDELDDCTHFLSCCLGKPGGGLQIPTSFPGGPYGILSANTLAELLIAKKWAEVVGDKLSDEDKAKEILTKTLEPGDLIAYYDPVKSRYRHLGLHLGNGTISCHTFCRHGSDWREVGWPKWTLLHPPKASRDGILPGGPGDHFRVPPVVVDQC